MTHVTRYPIIPVTRARVTSISRFPVTCVTSLWKRGLETPAWSRCRHNAEKPNFRRPSHAHYTAVQRQPGRQHNRYARVQHIHSAKVENGSNNASKHTGFPRCVQRRSNICRSGRGFRARSLMNFSTLGSRRARERANRSSAQYPQFPPKRPGGGGGGGQNPARVPFSCAPSISRRLPENFGGVLSENLVEHCLT